ncbi:hypothetical protein HID58_054553 [Brassica napus]|uniref:Uncharacterized protein n=1 Tax=Brassica napus TaxID=3708 RepID=A0ABQ8AHU2_BRANA|nr:hypothetical protein HID58_054553 [Brassica napus]
MVRDRTTLQSCLTRSDEATTRSDEATARFDEATARSDEPTARFDEATARFDEATARFDEATARSDEATARSNNDEELKRTSRQKLKKRRTQLSPMIVSNMIPSQGEVLINHDLPIAGNSNPLERETQISPMIVSNMVQTHDEVLITNDLPIAGSRNFCQRGTQKSPLIMSNMIQTQDEISSTHDSPIAGSSNVFEVLFKALTVTFIIIREEQKYTWRLNETTFKELTKSLVYNILVLDTILFLLQVVLLAIREDWTRWDDLLYMSVESQNCHLFLVDVVEKA